MIQASPSLVKARHVACDTRKLEQLPENCPSPKGSLSGRSMIHGSAFGHNAVHGIYHGDVTFILSSDAANKRHCEEGSLIQSSKRRKVIPYKNKNHGISKKPITKSDDRDDDDDDDDDEAGSSSGSTEGNSSGDSEENSMVNSEEDSEEDSDGRSLIDSE